MLEELSSKSNNLNKSRELLAYIDEVKSLAKKHNMEIKTIRQN